MERPVLNAFEWLRRRPWPKREPRAEPRIAALTVNYNTPHLIAALAFTLRRVLLPGALHRVVVVDNSTNDATSELLEGVRAAGLIEVVRNRRWPYHGIGLNRGMAHLRRTADVDYVWVLDSDVVILRPDTLSAAVASIRSEHAALVGQLKGEWYVHPSSMLLDPARVWRHRVCPFLEDGAPAAHLERTLRARGEKLVEFPFFRNGYALHIGAGTLAQIVNDADSTNRYFEWALTTDAHFHGNAEGPAILQRLAAIMQREVGELTSRNLLAACSRQAPVTLVDV